MTDTEADDIEDRAEEESSATGIIAGFLAAIFGTTTFNIVSNPDPVIRFADALIGWLVHGLIVGSITTLVSNPIAAVAGFVVFTVTIVAVEHWLTVE